MTAGRASGFSTTSEPGFALSCRRRSPRRPTTVRRSGRARERERSGSRTCRRSRKPLRLRAPFSALPEVCQYQIRQRRDEPRVLVVLRQDAPRDIGARVRASLRRELTDSGAVPPRIEVEPVAAIDREAGAGAKLKLVKSDEA